MQSALILAPHIDHEVYLEDWPDNIVLFCNECGVELEAWGYQDD